MNHKQKFDDYLTAVHKAQQADWIEQGKNLKFLPVYDFKTGDKYYRITRKNMGFTTTFCFVDRATGAIHKPETNSRPAPRAVANVNDDPSTWPLFAEDLYIHKKQKV